MNFYKNRETIEKDIYIEEFINKRGSKDNSKIFHRYYINNNDRKNKYKKEKNNDL